METLDDLRVAAQDFLSAESRDNISSKLSKILSTEPNNVLTLVFCGTFSSGKSSLINKLLNQQFKLPSGAVPITKFVTRLKYGAEFQASYIWNAKEYPLNLSDLKEVITGKLTLPDGSTEVVIKLPAKILKNDVEILDTPGFLENEELNNITRTAVTQADIAFFCCNASVPGKEFEKDYFQELEDTIGNFILIINHMDAIKSEEDFEVIKISMEYKLADKGRAILGYLTREKIFYTIAAGANTYLKEFQNFVSLICTGLSKKFRRRLQRYAYQKRTIHALQMLKDEVQTKIYYSEYLYACANTETNSEHQKVRKKFLAECKKISELLEKISIEGNELLETAITDSERKFDSLEAQDYVFNFRDKATAYLRDKLHIVPNTLCARLKQTFPTQNFDDGNFFADYIAAVNNYSVPEPVGRRVEKNGVSNVVSSIWSILSGSEKKNNYEMTYENYAAAAKIHLREHFLNRLQMAMNKYFCNLEVELKPNPPSKDAALLEEITVCKRTWIALDAEIAKYLNFCHEKFMWGLSRDNKLFPMVRGKFWLVT